MEKYTQGEVAEKIIMLCIKWISLIPTSTVAVWKKYCLKCKGVEFKQLLYFDIYWLSVVLGHGSGGFGV